MLHISYAQPRIPIVVYLSRAKDIIKDAFEVARPNPGYVYLSRAKEDMRAVATKNQIISSSYYHKNY
jgi:hypothetical protein